MGIGYALRRVGLRCLTGNWRIGATAMRILSLAEECGARLREMRGAGDGFLVGGFLGWGFLVSRFGVSYGWERLCVV